MNKTVWLSCLLATILLLPSAGMSQQTIQWEPSLDSAQRVASQTNRLVLIYFCGPSCVYCRRMEAEVFTQPSVASAVNANYVAVKIVADHFPATARRYGITNLPTMVITTPQGQVLDSKPGLVRADEYVARIGQVATDVKRRQEAVVAQIPPAVPPSATTAPGGNRALVGPNVGNVASMTQTLPGQSSLGAPVATAAVPPLANGAAVSPPMASQGPLPGQPAMGTEGTVGTPPSGVPAMGAPPAGYGQSQCPIAAPPGMASQPAPGGPVGPGYGTVVQPPSVVQQPLSPPQNSVAPPIAAGNPPLGLDGFCPVSLMEKQRWVRGDPHWGVNHRGRIYLFAGPEEQRRFFADPDRYAPIAAGNDVVLAAEQGQSVAGTREHGVFFSNRVYLFSSEASLDKFARNPGAYANQAEAVRGGANYPRQQWR
jgi:thioredoxin-related protein/YHS domain-containing protein